MHSSPSRLSWPINVKLNYVEQGDPAGVPVLLLHGWTDSWRSYELVLPHLPESIRAFAISQRGHGDSDRPDSGYDPDDFAADVAAFMDALEIESAVIVGHSMGSFVAQCFAMNYPERTRGLVLAGSFTTCRGNPAVSGLWDEVSQNLRIPVDPVFVREFQQSTLAQPVPPAYLDTVVRESLKAPAPVWRAVAEGLLETDFSAELDNKAPTLIFWGDRETFFLHDEQDALAAGIADSELVIYEGAGHALHWEEPQRFAADLAAFVENRLK